jgi:tripartite-type tricarboxylate transporter receptor subunit TctC
MSRQCGSENAAPANFVSTGRTEMSKISKLLGAALIASSLSIADAVADECIAPADPGGGWDFTCRTVGKLL